MSQSRQRIYLSPPHMSGLEQQFVQEVFASNWIAPLGPQVDAFEADPSTRPSTSPFDIALRHRPSTSPFDIAQDVAQDVAQDMVRRGGRRAVCAGAQLRHGRAAPGAYSSVPPDS